MEDIRTWENTLSLCSLILSTEEELVEFQDWMVDEKNPNGITILDEMEFIKRNPKYLETTKPL